MHRPATKIMSALFLAIVCLQTLLPVQAMEPPKTGAANGWADGTCKWGDNDAFLSRQPDPACIGPAQFTISGKPIENPPLRQIKTEVAVAIDGGEPTKMDQLVLLENNWSGFMAGEFRINLRARPVAEDLVELAFYVYEGAEQEPFSNLVMLTKYDTTSSLSVGSTNPDSDSGSYRIEITPHR